MHSLSNARKLYSKMTSFDLLFTPLLHCTQCLGSAQIVVFLIPKATYLRPRHIFVSVKVGLSPELLRVVNRDDLCVDSPTCRTVFGSFAMFVCRLDNAAPGQSLHKLMARQPTTLILVQQTEHIMQPYLRPSNTFNDVKHNLRLMAVLLQAVHRLSHNS